MNALSASISMTSLNGSEPDMQARLLQNVEGEQQEGIASAEGQAPLSMPPQPQYSFDDLELKALSAMHSIKKLEDDLSIKRRRAELIKLTDCCARRTIESIHAHIKQSLEQKAKIPDESITIYYNPSEEVTPSAWPFINAIADTAFQWTPSLKEKMTYKELSSSNYSAQAKKMEIFIIEETIRKVKKLLKEETRFHLAFAFEVEMLTPYDCCPGPCDSPKPYGFKVTVTLNRDTGSCIIL